MSATPEKHATLRRIARRAMACIILGAILSVLIAWSFALLPQPVRPQEPQLLTPLERGERLGYLGTLPGRSQVVLLDRWSWDDVIVTEYWPAPGEPGPPSPPAIQPKQPVPHWVGPPRSESESLLIANACGWPTLCMAGVSCEDFSPRPRNRTKHSEVSFKAFGRTIDLPLKPIWWGLLLNTFFYGSVILAVWCSLIAIRGRTRRRRGRCAHCGYDSTRHHADRCPECGLRTA